METTGLVIAGRRMTIPRVLKRVLQVISALCLSALCLFVLMVANGMIAGKQPSLQAGMSLWLAFVKRPDIQLTAIITAVVTVTFVYWQRNQERRAGGGRSAS